MINGESQKICSRCKTNAPRPGQRWCPDCLRKYASERYHNRRKMGAYTGNPAGWEYVQKLAREWQAAKEKTEKAKAKMR